MERDVPIGIVAGILRTARSMNTMHPPNSMAHLQAFDITAKIMTKLGSIAIKNSGGDDGDDSDDDGEGASRPRSLGNLVVDCTEFSNELSQPNDVNWSRQASRPDHPRFQ